jgi:hypothetical protein
LNSKWRIPSESKEHSIAEHVDVVGRGKVSWKSDNILADHYVKISMG